MEGDINHMIALFGQGTTAEVIMSERGSAGVDQEKLMVLKNMELYYKTAANIPFALGSSDMAEKVNSWRVHYNDCVASGAITLADADDLVFTMVVTMGLGLGWDTDQWRAHFQATGMPWERTKTPHRIHGMEVAVFRQDFEQCHKRLHSWPRVLDTMKGKPYANGIGPTRDQRLADRTLISPDLRPRTFDVRRRQLWETEKNDAKPCWMFCIREGLRDFVLFTQITNLQL